MGLVRTFLKLQAIKILYNEFLISLLKKTAPSMISRISNCFSRKLRQGFVRPVSLSPCPLG